MRTGESIWKLRRTVLSGAAADEAVVAVVGCCGCDLALTLTTTLDELAVMSAML